MSKISELSDGGVIQSNDTLIAVRSGGNVKVTYGGSTTANIDGGTIDDTVIGGTTPAAGSFTTLELGGTGVTATATELNVLDGITATTAELNFTDGVTSNIQTQLNTKAPIASPTFTGTATIPTADINGGTIDGTVIGGSTAAAGSFTTLGATGDVIIADKIVHSGDTNTAIRFPAADTVTVETAGSERMRIDSTGNVGIGTSSPLMGLQISQSTGNSVFGGLDGNINAFLIRGNLYFDFPNARSQPITTGFQTQIKLQNNDGTIRFDTSPSSVAVGSAATITERMLITSAGNVGIGTSSPGAKLDVSGALNGNGTIKNYLVLGENSGSTGVNGDGVGIQFRHKNTSGTTFQAAISSVITSSNAAALVFSPAPPSSAPVEAMRITSAGILLVGTATEIPSPHWGAGTRPLNVAGQFGVGAFTTHVNSSSGAGLLFQKSRNTTIGGHTVVQNNDNLVDISIEGSDGAAYRQAAFIRTQVDGSTISSTSMPGRIIFGTSASGSVSPAERLRIDSAGNVGIGTSSPGARLNVFDTTANAATALVRLNGQSNFNLDIQSVTNGAGTVGNRFNFDIGSSGGEFSFSNAGGERMRITSAGNVLVGTTSTSANIIGSKILPAGRLTLVTADSGTQFPIQFGREITGVVGSVSTTASATAYNTSSDERLKENITDAYDAGDKIDAIKVRQYDWKVDGLHQDYGMVAQELMTVAPEAVSGDPDSDQMMGVDYSKLVPMLIKEVQSLRTRVAQLETAA